MSSTRGITNFSSVFFLSILVLAGCAARPPDETPPDPIAGASVTVIERGWHTDIGLPADRLTGPLAEIGRRYPGARFLVFGFGDAAYYQSHDESLLGRFTALFPGPGVILLTVLGTPPGAAFGPGQVVTVRVSQADLDRIAAFIWRTLGERENRLGDGPYPGSAFYGAARRYDGLHNCNDWTALALRSGGLAVDPAGVVFAGQVMAQIRQVFQRQGGDVPSEQMTFEP